MFVNRLCRLLMRSVRQPAKSCVPLWRNCSQNEELQSTNEELQTSKEELQSSNEELQTLNEELKNRNQSLNVINDDCSTC